MDQQTTTDERTNTNNVAGVFNLADWMGKAVDYHPGIIAIVRQRDLSLLFVNATSEQYLGFTNADLPADGQPMAGLMQERSLILLNGQLTHVTENPGARCKFVIYKISGKNGSTMAYYVYAAPFTPPNCPWDDLFLLQLHPDVSSWAMPFTSFESRELFLELYSKEDYGTYEWGDHPDKVIWSDGMYQIYELDAATTILDRQLVLQYTHADDKAMVMAASAVTLSTGATLDLEFRIVTQNKNIKIIHTIARGMVDLQGKVVKLVGCMKDITAQRQTEENLKNRVDELNISNRELEEFAYVASHDLQEPLRKITTFSDRLHAKYQELLTGDGTMYLSRIVASAENMRALINSLLEFSKISKTEQPFRKTNLNALVKQVMTDLELVIEETRTVITCGQMPEVDAISSQIKQLFANIISNAIKFQKPGVSPVINIQWEKLTTEGKRALGLPKKKEALKISITDNGIGFEEEYAQRIFQVFQRLHGKSEYPGSGIGLAICKKILEHHKGIIYAENLPGIGSRFIFTLPMVQDQAQATH